MKLARRDFVLNVLRGIGAAVAAALWPNANVEAAEEEPPYSVTASDDGWGWGADVRCGSAPVSYAATAISYNPIAYWPLDDAPAVNKWSIMIDNGTRPVSCIIVPRESKGTFPHQIYRCELSPGDGIALHNDGHWSVYKEGAITGDIVYVYSAEMLGAVFEPTPAP